MYMCTAEMYSDGAVLLGQELFLWEEKALQTHSSLWTPSGCSTYRDTAKILYTLLSWKTSMFLLLKYDRPLEDDSTLTAEDTDEDVEEDGGALDEDDEEFDGDEGD